MTRNLLDLFQLLLFLVAWLALDVSEILSIFFLLFAFGITFIKPRNYD